MKKFLDERRRADYEKILYEQFVELYKLTDYLDESRLKTSIESERRCNEWKNRYYARQPYDDNRVILENSMNTRKGSDYINASFITSFSKYKYIAAMGPLEHTIHDFFLMLKQFKIKTIICACNDKENGMEKCFRYWSNNPDISYKPIKDLEVKLTSKPRDFDGFIQRDLIIKSKYVPEGYEVTQFHLTNWPDFGVPEKIEPILFMLEEMHKKMNEVGKLSDHEDEYLAIHCSAGCGRTGTIIGIDLIWNAILTNELPSDCMNTIARSLRKQRINMIETFEQYQMFDEAITYLFNKTLRSNSKN